VTARALEWREAARADLLAIVDYISDDDPEAAQRLKDEIEERASSLVARPKLYRSGRVAGTREMVIRPNYIVVYAEDERAIVILRVLHAARQWPPA
jgi:toxin ParE1/3/4